jgi:hypothetical protein
MTDGQDVGSGDDNSKVRRVLLKALEVADNREGAAEQSDHNRSSVPTTRDSSDYVPCTGDTDAMSDRPSTRDSHGDYNAQSDSGINRKRMRHGLGLTKLELLTTIGKYIQRATFQCHLM